jgi:hypothetical protein
MKMKIARELLISISKTRMFQNTNCRAGYLCILKSNLYDVKQKILDFDSLDCIPFSVQNHSLLIVLHKLYPELLMLNFQDILLRDQGGNASGGFTKVQKEIVQQHLSYRLRFSLRVSFGSLCSGFVSI